MIAGLVGGAPPSTAQPAATSPAAAAQAFGLLGEWAIDCQAPASGATPYVIWLGQRDGTIMQELLRGMDGIQQNTVARSGKALSATQFELVLGSGAQAAVLVIELRDKKWHTLTSTAANGQKLIVNGVFAGSSDAAPWFTKCRD